jgi:hypothetical protein
MNHELAKGLKDAGFPQDLVEGHYVAVVIGVRKVAANK